MVKARKTATIYLEHQPYIDAAPVQPQALYQQACANDAITVQSWRETWVSQIKANRAVFGSFKDHSIGQILNKHRHMPAFILGSGPSLKRNAHLLANGGNLGIPVISCLHNFHFCEDLGIDVDYYVTLDSGPVTIEEVSEGGKPDEDYWAKTKGKTLLAYIGSHPNLLAKWQGDIYFFNCAIPNADVEKEINAIERFRCLVSSGGNVLGAALYITKAFLGCATSIFLGADFSFSYDEKFHGWDSKYDAKLGDYIRLVDIYGNRTKTWQSYANFKAWFDWVAQQVPGEYINCTEGGIFGAYPEGNIRAVKQMDLEDCLVRFGMTKHMAAQAANPDIEHSQILF